MARGEETKKRKRRVIPYNDSNVQLASMEKTKEKYCYVSILYQVYENKARFKSSSFWHPDEPVIRFMFIVTARSRYETDLSYELVNFCDESVMRERTYSSSLPQTNFKLLCFSITHS
mmetsp:Transcript_34921/g.41709  ORF Transcript_34921/g.41709 Transcript_34921/m.41709 type:complete len:117 (-) Transcript_34921:123-473(-)